MDKLQVGSVSHRNKQQHPHVDYSLLGPVAGGVSCPQQQVTERGDRDGVKERQGGEVETCRGGEWCQG